MSNLDDISVDIPGALVWTPPKPTWNDMILGGSVVIQTYTLCNVSDVPVTIYTIELQGLEDKRVQITSGSGIPNLRIAPRETATIQIQINPRTLGVIKQILTVTHSGIGFPLTNLIQINVSNGVLWSEGGTPSRSYLDEESTAMDRSRRIVEQDGHRRLARVHAREHTETQNQAPEGEMQNNILQNPWLNSQRFDGVDPNLNPEPPLNTEARREFDNERREQEMEKQLRLGNMPKMSTAPKPQGP